MSRSVPTVSRRSSASSTISASRKTALGGDGEAARWPGGSGSSTTNGLPSASPPRLARTPMVGHARRQVARERRRRRPDRRSLTLIADTESSAGGSSGSAGQAQEVGQVEPHLEPLAGEADRIRHRLVDAGDPEPPRIRARRVAGRARRRRRPSGVARPATGARRGLQGGRPVGSRRPRAATRARRRRRGRRRGRGVAERYGLAHTSRAHCIKRARAPHVAPDLSAQLRRRTPHVRTPHLAKLGSGSSRPCDPSASRPALCLAEAAGIEQRSIRAAGGPVPA